MTVLQFGKQLVAYYGKWKETVHGDAVREYVSTKSPPFLEGLWEVLKERRSPRAGPPSFADMMELADEAATRMVKYLPPPLIVAPKDRIREPHGRPPVTPEELAKWSTIEDAGDRWLSPREAGEALTIVYARLRAKAI